MWVSNNNISSRYIGRSSDMCLNQEHYVCLTNRNNKRSHNCHNQCQCRINSNNIIILTIKIVSRMVRTTLTIVIGLHSV